MAVISTQGLTNSVSTKFGPYGGQFVPETLMPSLLELDAAYREARADVDFQTGLDELLRT